MMGSLALPPLVRLLVLDDFLADLRTTTISLLKNRLHPSRLRSKRSGLSQYQEWIHAPPTQQLKLLAAGGTSRAGFSEKNPAG
jgi:hypothetical protein